MNSKYNNLWLQIQKILDKKGWSQRRLAEETGIKQRTLDTYKFEDRDPSFTNVCKIADALHVSLDELRGEKNAINNK